MFLDAWRPHAHPRTSRGHRANCLCPYSSPGRLGDNPAEMITKEYLKLVEQRIRNVVKVIRGEAIGDPARTLENIVADIRVVIAKED
mgnify:CR=1 FL=1